MGEWLQRTRAWAPATGVCRTVTRGVLSPRLCSWQVMALPSCLGALVPSAGASLEATTLSSCLQNALGLSLGQFLGINHLVPDTHSPSLAYLAVHKEEGQASSPSSLRLESGLGALASGSLVIPVWTITGSLVGPGWYSEAS